MKEQPSRRSVIMGSAALALSPWSLAQTAYPERNIELVIPYAAGGGTDALARAFAEVSRKYLKQSITPLNKPGASGSIGWTDVIHAKPDGYKIALVTVELTFLHSLGLAKFTHDSLVPIARLNYDPSAITVRADAPWNSIEEFLAAARKNDSEMRVGNAGTGSIWNLTASALEDKAQLKFNQVPYQGAAPAVLALLGGHIDAVAVSPAEVGVHVTTGKLKLLAVMSDQRIKGFESVPTFKERGIDVALGAWRGLAAPKNTPADVLDVLKKTAEKVAKDPAFVETLQKLNLGYAYADDAAFKSQWESDSAYYKQLIAKIGLKVQ